MGAEARLKWFEELMEGEEGEESIDNSCEHLDWEEEWRTYTSRESCFRMRENREFLCAALCH